MCEALALMIAAAGHAIATEYAAADLLLLDGLHPLHDLPTPMPPTLRLVGTPSGEDLAQEIVCPIHPDRLIQQLTALGRHPGSIPLSQGWQLNLQARAAEHPTHPRISLTEKETLLLAALLKTPGEAVDRETLLNAVWGMEGSVETHTLETHIYRLRTKLEAHTSPPAEIINDSKSYKIALTH